ncbi:cytochrome P450 [Parasphingopyxis algicola]|uniref:cytochrome P450 n=1 Tax=Parasphingopyxis algicola TaxID=2026624 RepID=UPI0015A28184|nr:cytochrome P450 [Parasphingopyxis algicola]QLC26473.1 cytochrome P450 [Parasphingopyxis algicola]
MAISETISPFNPDAPHLRVDPYPTFGDLREQDPVHRAEFSYWVVSRYNDVRSVLMDRTGYGQGDFVKNIQLFYGPDFDVLAHPSYRWLSEVFLMQDPPRHTRVRGLVTGGLTAKRVRAMEPRIREITNHLIDAFIDEGQTDMIANFAYELPVLVMCDMLGIESEDERLASVIDAIAQSFIVFEARALDEQELETADREIIRLETFFAELFERRKVEPKDDLTTALVQSGTAEDALTHHELVTVAIGLFGAGFETTAHMIGNGLLCFSRFRDQWRKLREDPKGLAASAVNEVLRYESSLIATYRTALEPHTIRGQDIMPGEKVLTLIGAANRDPRQFDRPDEFDITREDATHMSFGGGIHFCAGAELARLEGRIAFTELARRLPHLTVETESPAWREGFLFRGMSRLPASW